MRTLFTRRSLLCFALVATVVCPGSVAAQQKEGAQHHVVTMRQMHFEPAQLTLHEGDTVEWRNEDIFAHTATADDGSFDSGLIQPGSSWSMTFRGGKSAPYHCRPHPNMTAQLVLAAAQTEKSSGTPSGSIGFKFPSGPHELHPILVNFTAALLPLALLSELLGIVLGRRSLHNAGWWMTLYAALITPLTAAAGWWWKHQAGPDLPARIITVHQWLGTLAVVLFVAWAAWRWSFEKADKRPSHGYLVILAIVVLAVVYQGSLGGQMVFGR